MWLDDRYFSLGGIKLDMTKFTHERCSGKELVCVIVNNLDDMFISYMDGESMDMESYDITEGMANTTEQHSEAILFLEYILGIVLQKISLRTESLPRLIMICVRYHKAHIKVLN